MSYHWRWSVFLDTVPSGGATYVDWIVAGVETTAALSLCAWGLALLVGSVMGVLRTVPSRPLRALAAAYVELFRNVPLLVQLFVWYFVFPELIPASWGDVIKQANPFFQGFLAGTIGLGLFTGARVCEQVRAGIESLSRGQRSAGLALGLTLPQTYRHVLVPMAFRIIVPPLTSELLNIFKNSAVASTLNLLELTAQGRQLVDYTAHAYESFIAVTLLYAAMNLVLMGVMRLVEARTRVPGFIGGGR
jgi:glutamate/aspartate transport system permease protein